MENTSNGNELSFNSLSFFQSSINANVPYILSSQYNNDVNIYVVSSDVPCISDIDNDGDLDILNFGVQGSVIEYHKNISNDLDTLIFEMKMLVGAILVNLDCQIPAPYLIPVYLMSQTLKTQ